MQRRNRRTNPRQTASRHNRPSSATAYGALEFGRVRVLLRQRQLLADGVQFELGTRAFNLLVALLEADGSLLVALLEADGSLLVALLEADGSLLVALLEADGSLLVALLE